MEQRLFFIGVGMGMYAWGTRAAMRRGSIAGRWRVSLWHALFCAFAAFSALLMVLVSWEQGEGVSLPSGFFGIQRLLPAVLGSLFCGLWGLWSCYRHGLTREDWDRYLREDQEWSETVFSAVLLAAFMMYFLIQAFKIPSGSMRSTLLEGDHLFVNKLVYGVRIPWAGRRIWKYRDIRRGDVVVFRFPSEDPEEVHCGGPQYGKDFIKRVIGLPGEGVMVRGRKVYINGTPLAEERYAQYLDPGRFGPPAVELDDAQEYQREWESRKLASRIGETMRDFFGPVKVPTGDYFVMGDNRDRSCDSRFWGPVPKSYIKGKAWFIYWPPGRIQEVR